MHLKLSEMHFQVGIRHPTNSLFTRSLNVVSLQVNSLANNKSSKPPSSNIKSTTHQLPTEQAAVATDTPSTPPARPKEQTVHTAVTQQNGNDQEDIFSPLRENKTSAEISNKQTTVPGSEEVSLSSNFKENNPPDGLGIFSPVGSNLSAAAAAAASTQLHYRDGVSSGTVNSSVPLGRSSPRTLGVATPAGTGPSALQNARLSAASSLTDPNNAHDLAPDSSTKPFADTTHGGSLAPSSTKLFQFEGNQRKGATGGHGATGSLHVETDGTQTLSDSPPKSISNINRATESTIRTGQGSPHGSPSQLRRSGGTEQPDQLVSQTMTAVTAGQTVSPGQSSIFDHAKHSVDPLPSGAVGMATAPVADGAASITSNAGLLPFQVQFIKNLIDESLDEFRMALHRDIVNVQVEMLRQFQIQQNELKGMLEKYSVNEALVTEIERLKEENNRLKSKY
ncbi:hypothetical protein ACROYT_G033343 [Oculina patagonica]